MNRDALTPLKQLIVHGALRDASSPDRPAIFDDEVPSNTAALDADALARKELIEAELIELYEFAALFRPEEQR